jgi:DNA-binding Lrp family transcriptional regulator
MMMYSEIHNTETEPAMPPRKTTLDELDALIIRELHADARIPAALIARKAQANERTIRKRIERLTAAGVIRLTAILDPQAFGYNTAADIFIEVSPGREPAVLKRLIAMPEITYLALGQESREISIEARFKDSESLRRFLGQTLPGIPGVAITRYALVPRILRNIDEWMPRMQDLNPA